MNTIRILNVDIQSLTCRQLLEQLDEGVLVTPNLDHMVKLQSDPEFLECYRRAEWVVCDSRILYFCSKLLPVSIPEVIPGSSFFNLFYKYHADDKSCRIFILGAKEGVADKAMTLINKSVGRDIVVDALSPSFGFEKNEEENEAIFKRVNESGANVVLVGVGAPKQEKWIMKHKDRMPGVRIWMALGATIDFEAGNISRAPVFMQKIGMEWFYRFIKEPRRLFKRYFIDDPCFFYYFIRQLMHRY